MTEQPASTLPHLPPAARGRVALSLTAAAARGRFELQTCEQCGAVQYPPREVCHRCLSVRLRWREQSGAGKLLAITQLAHSNDAYFRERLPWRVGLVQLDQGPTLMVHLHGGLASAPSLVRVICRLDRSGQAVLIGLPAEDVHMSEDKMLREMGCDPKSRAVLVTDGQSRLGVEIVRSLIAAGAEKIWVGQAQPGANHGLPFAASPQVEPVALDLADPASVSALAQRIAEQVDILINSADAHIDPAAAGLSAADTAEAEMNVNYFGLLRLMQAFGPGIKKRSSEGGTCAWVNLLSLYALSNFPGQETYSASKAAAHSLTQALRADLQRTGVRVTGVFPGLLAEEAGSSAMPAIGAAALAQEIIKALREGVEDVYPGAAAQEWFAHWRESPKVFEREIAAGAS